MDANSTPIEDAQFDVKIHRYSQLFRDAYDLQRYFIQKRDEVCNNGELIQTNALSFKYNSLDQYVVAITNAPAGHTNDEAEILRVNEGFRTLEMHLKENDGECSGDSVGIKNLEIGSFWYIDRALVTENLKVIFSIIMNYLHELVV